MSDVQDAGSTSVDVYRSPLIPSIDTNALSVDATSLGLPADVGTSVAQGEFLNGATATEPVCVLAGVAAQRLGIDRVYPGERIWLNNMWFYVAGILNPAPLTPEIDSEVLAGYTAAEKYLGFNGYPTDNTVKVEPTSETAEVYNVLAATANPESPSEVDVPQPSAALVAQADAQAALNGLFLGLGAVGPLTDGGECTGSRSGAGGSPGGGPITYWRNGGPLLLAEISCRWSHVTGGRHHRSPLTL